MKRNIYILITIILTACGTPSTDKNNITTPSDETDSTGSTEIIVPAENNETEEVTNYDYATYFIVVADTSKDYYLLHKKMFDLNKQLNIPVDTMRRLYNKSKDLIALPDDDEDEMYAGEYFPRRFPSNTLSLEYLNIYQEQAGEKTIALVTGIYETETSADSVVTILQETEKKAFKIKANMYIGCMH